MRTGADGRSRLLFSHTRAGPAFTGWNGVPRSRSFESCVVEALHLLMCVFPAPSPGLSVWKKFAKGMSERASRET